MSAFETGNKLRTGPNGEPLTKTCLTTNSLKILDLADPYPEAICIEDIAHGLSQHVRWAGQGRWLSVAQHSVAVTRYIEENYRAMAGDIDPAPERLLRKALMHDAHEAYIGDLSGGLKYLLRDSLLPFLIDHLDEAIAEAIPGLELGELGWVLDKVLNDAEAALVPSEYNMLFQGLNSSFFEGRQCAKMSKELFLHEARRLGLA